MMHLATKDWLVLAVAAFVAVVSLVRLMRQRRDQMLDQLSFQAEQEHRRLEEERRVQQSRKGGGRPAGPSRK